VIPDDIRKQLPMLASQSKAVHPDLEIAVSNLVSAGTFTFDIKLDGVRAVIAIDNGEVTITNRLGRDTRFRYPELVDALGMAYPNKRIVLDGEIVVLNPDGTPNFALAHRRDAQENALTAKTLSVATPATFIAFDILFYEGDDFRRHPYTARNALLRKLVTTSPRLHVITSSPDGQKMWAFVKKHKLEGLIAKKLTSTYVPGRSSAWIKLKPVRSVSAIVSGTDQGEGARASTFGALHLVLLDENNLMVSIGKVGSGFDNKDLALVVQHITDPAASPLIVEVEYQDVSADKKLRFPVYKGIRNDVGLLDCTLDQLDYATPKTYLH
jgi:bifunctional non-homologous end joining protein LigD